MSEVAIRELKGQEMLDTIFPLLIYSFTPSPPLPDKEKWLEHIQPREGLTYVALFEDGLPATAAGSREMTQQVRGALFGMSAIWGVASAPEARRKGYARRVMGQLLAITRNAGQPLSTLYPFRESFYERLGYVTFPAPRVARFSPAGLLLLLEKDPGCQVELSLIGDAYEDYHAYLREVQQQTPGMAVPSVSYKARLEQRPSWVAQAKVDGRRVGMLVYKLTGTALYEFTMRTSHFYYSTPQGKYLLLQWMARHADQAREVEICLPPFEHPETWLSDLKITTEMSDHIPMGRVVDVAKISGMQVGPGCFTARVSDSLCPWNEDVWQFEEVDGRLQVNRVKEADCELSIQALSALVYGTNDPADFAIRGWGEPSLPLQMTMRNMFPPLLPYLGEIF
jgi:predicted acetyltransferase